MPDNNPAAKDVTKDWQATQGQKSSAGRLRLFAALAWIVATRRRRPADDFCPCVACQSLVTSFVLSGMVKTLFIYVWAGRMSG